MMYHLLMKRGAFRKNKSVVASRKRIKKGLLPDDRNDWGMREICTRRDRWVRRMGEVETS